MTRLLAVFFLALGLLEAGPAPAQTFTKGPQIDAAIEQAIREDKIPGAVVLIGNNGHVVYRKAYGWRALEPSREKMTLDVIFDAASLTKVIATTSCLMRLFEDGKIRLNDRVTEYLPEFQGEKSSITVRQLMTHFSGLRPDLDLEPPWSGYETGIQRALTDKPVAAPGEKFTYSDINFELLGEIVRRVGGKPLDEFSHDAIFAPLGMNDTMFTPPERFRPRIAPTEILKGTTSPLRGVVHDPTARYMGGVAGHAGLFTTADDLAKFAEMMLGKGQRGSVRLFSPLTVEKFTTPQSPPDQPTLRGLGWDIDSPFSGNRGELFPIGSYGHTGFTGTSIWIDPVSQSYVILLANSVHPHQRKPITSLRGRVATIAAAGLGVQKAAISITGYNETLGGAGLYREVARNGQVLTGLDVLEQQGFQPLMGKRVGLITNQTGIDRTGARNLDRMLRAGVKVTALFSPEHGIAGAEDRENIGNSKDPATGIPIWSLYSAKGRRPSGEMLRDIDVLVFDIQDIGTRFYTYSTTMGYCLEESANQRIPILVLDRPNPITGVHVEGPLLDAELESFVGYHPIPLRHGLTSGELAMLFNHERKIGAKLQVISMKDWQRGDWFDSTGLPWVNPSPNIRSLTAALLYPGVALLESSSNYSVGRGTDAPFEQIGALWIRGMELARHINEQHIPGIRVYPTRFRPESSNLQGQWIEGIRFVITDREVFDSSRFGLELAVALRTLYPGQIAFGDNAKLIGRRQIIRQLEAGSDADSIVENEQDVLEHFSRIRTKYLLYK